MPCVFRARPAREKGGQLSDARAAPFLLAKGTLDPSKGGARSWQRGTLDPDKGGVQSQQRGRSILAKGALNAPVASLKKGRPPPPSTGDLALHFPPPPKGERKGLEKRAQKREVVLSFL